MLNNAKYLSYISYSVKILQTIKHLNNIFKQKSNNWPLGHLSNQTDEKQQMAVDIQCLVYELAARSLELDAEWHRKGNLQM